MRVVDFWFPEPAKTVAPLRRSECTIEAKVIVNELELSQVPVKSWFVPRLMLITFALGVLFSTHCRAETMSLVLWNDPSAASTLTATIFVEGATPIGAIVPLLVMIPATFVPWPLSSCALPEPFCVL